MKCPICGKQENLVQYHNSCPGLCTYATSHYLVLHPGGKITLSKSIEHIERIYRGFNDNRKKKLTT